MLNNVVAAAALMATAVVADAVGTAKVVNMCSYPVTVCNTPAEGGGYSEIDNTLQTNGEYSQQYTQLSNDQGWSIKLSKSANLDSILQYEYTFHNDGIIWYDLSEVNGNPWDGNWEISASGDGCTPKQQAYRYATDDAYGMQACNSGADITVILCSGDSEGGSGSSAAPSSSEAPETSTAAAPSPSEYSSSSSEETSTAAPAPTTTSSPVQSYTTATSSHHWHHSSGWEFNDRNAVAASPSTALTTFATVAVSSAPEGYDVTVTDIATAIVTAYVTATDTAYAKRHAHHPRHAHNRQA